MTQCCAECGKEMLPQENGSYLQCCSGAGYWLNKKPVADDSASLPVVEYKGFYFYRNYTKWPRNKKPKAPKLNGVQT